MGSLFFMSALDLLEWFTAELELQLKSLSHGGAFIFPKEVSCTPGLKGRLIPALASSGRTYFHTSNIATNYGQMHQFRLIKVNGRILLTLTVSKSELA
ncbi:MAG: hypothetical protein F4X05_01030 [Rhodothermaceae bacterium]|nr:hypothetical protein [Rhodothermaceae bacterium]